MCVHHTVKRKISSFCIIYNYSFCVHSNFFSALVAAESHSFLLLCRHRGSQNKYFLGLGTFLLDFCSVLPQPIYKSTLLPII
jgi:hypothetical protein